MQKFPANKLAAPATGIKSGSADEDERLFVCVDDLPPAERAGHAEALASTVNRANRLREALRLLGHPKDPAEMQAALRQAGPALEAVGFVPMRRDDGSSYLIDLRSNVVLP